MNDVTELKEFARVHAKALQLPAERYDEVLAGITSDEDGAPGSWTAQWSAMAGELEDAGELLPAFLCYTLARFPVVDGPARQAAYRKCRSVFDRWRAGQPDIQRVTASPAGREVVAWAGGLSAAEPKPVLMVAGGIVSLKEQWAPVTLQAAALGMAIVVTELPGVGENTLPYDREGWRMLPALLDAVATVALSTDCNPGSSFTSSMPFCVAVAVREMGMTPDEAVWSATAGGAAALRRADVGRLAPGARADAALLDAPSHVHLAYRPGVPLVAEVWRRGKRVPGAGDN